MKKEENLLKKIFMRNSEFLEEWKRRRERRNKELSSIWKLVLRIIILIFVILLIKFFSTGGPDKFFKMLTKSEEFKTEIIIDEEE
ncbi:MAG: hypothetical protein KAW92_14220 [Candidatus Cloacimonetes bacterium]|nr:hypothetical protein [Candidatus Cloacimonadota bacterium]